VGARAKAAHAEDVAEIAHSGRRAVTVVLIEQRGRDITMIATVVGLTAATMH
jgi:hypothetical protein